MTQTTLNLLISSADPAFADRVCEALAPHYSIGARTVCSPSHPFLEQDQTEVYDLALIDQPLDEEQPFDCLGRVKARWPDLPTILYLDMAMEALADASLAAGADYYILHTPLAHSRLPALVRSVLEWATGRARLRDSEEALRLIFENAFDGISIQEELPGVRRRRLIDCNERYAEMAGRSRTELLEIGNMSGIQQSVGPAFSDMENLLIRREHRRYRGLFSWARPDGRENIIEYSAAPIDVGGRALTVGVDRDITEQVLAERETRRLLENVQTQARQMQALIEATPQAILLLDRECKVLIFNPAAQAAVGGSNPLTPGQPLRYVGDLCVTSLLPTDGEEIVREVAIGEEPATTYEITIRQTAADSSETGWLLILRNVTRIRQRQQRQEQQARLAAVGQLAAGIAHDFNNLLGSTLLLVQLADRDPQTSERARKFLTSAIEQIQRGADLVGRILAFGRKSLMSKTTRDLADFLQETGQLLQRTLGDSIVVTIAQRPGNYLFHADYTLLQQVCLNLAINARDAMPGGGRLRFALSRLAVDSDEMAQWVGLARGDWYEIWVSDSGHGIPADVLPRIFEPFFTTKEAGQGSGLGLAQVYGIVHQHQGEIRVESQPGQGALFRIFLPAPTEDFVVPGLGESEPPEKSGCNSARPILVVEDQAVLLGALCDVLEAAGFSPVGVASSQEAVALVAAEPERFSLVLSDLSMPGMDGLEMHRELRGHSPDLRTLILSGYPMDSQGRQWREEGVLGWLKKPIDSKELVAQVRAALDT